MNGPIRRTRPGNAVARGQTPTRHVEEQGRGFVSASIKKAKQPPYHEESREVSVLTERFTQDDPAAFVTVKAGLTIDMGNYESLRIDCSVSLPCNRLRLEEAYVLASEFVADRIAEEEQNWTGTNQRSKR